MILDIADLVTRHCGVPDATTRHLRAAFLMTTEPTFLIFAEHQAHPLFAVKVGHAVSLETRAVLADQLHELMPDAIARPLGVVPLNGDRALLVQNGLPGVPWYRLGDRFKSPADWRALRARAIARLREFHTAVATQPDWVREARLFGAELRSMAGRLEEDLAPLGDRVQMFLASVSSELAALGPVRGVWQHGDFVLNNLLVDDNRLHIVDLDDFGKWSGPFIDAFALAHSVQFLAAQHVPWPHLADDLAACAAAELDANSYTPRQKIAFLAYFLLAAMIDAKQKPGRTGIGLIYRATLRDLIDDDSRYEHAFRSSHSRDA